LRSKADINDPEKPIGSFMFLGPTGVGKTEVARVLAKTLFDSEKQMIRLDMSEYMEKHSVSKLIGSPPGYVGFENGGQLTEKIRRQPYSIVLFDEIEKAHPDVLNVLLQILDDGQITDSKGKKVNFKNTIIIMTSNIGSDKILKKMKEDVIITEVNKFFRPEFINRIDEIIVFNALNLISIKKIVSLELQKLAIRVQKQGISIHFGEEVFEFVAKKAYDPIFGARPIKRFIKKTIESQLAEDIISGDINEDNSYDTKIIGQKILFQRNKLN
jgi:ATP-dependent Clp protease ATP-binding subunit ClpB